MKGEERHEQDDRNLRTFDTAHTIYRIMRTAMNNRQCSAYANNEDLEQTACPPIL